LTVTVLVSLIPIEVLMTDTTLTDMVLVDAIAIVPVLTDLAATVMVDES
jgi:hypothetical protein